MSGDEVRSSSANGGFFDSSFLLANGDTDLAMESASPLFLLPILELADLAKMSLMDCTEGDSSFLSGLFTIADVSSSVVELAKQDMPNFEVLRSRVLEDDRSSLEACREVFNNEVDEEIEPILGISSTMGLDPEGGEEPGEKLLLAEVV